VVPHKSGSAWESTPPNLRFTQVPTDLKSAAATRQARNFAFLMAFMFTAAADHSMLSCMSG